MKVHRGLDHLPEFRNPVLTIGSYDGVHHGHRTIISRLRAKARESDGESIILTFHPHPREVVFPNDTSLRLLNTLDEKIALLEETGIDHLIVMPFTVEFSQINPYKYVNDVLIKTIKVQHLIIGYDHKFGLNREGNIDLLKLYAQEGKFTVEEIPRKDVDDLAVSSTKIRNNLLGGKIELANTMLGAPYMISGTIGKGSQIAGALGFPTANCVIDNDKKLIPSPGTYAARASCLGKDFIGMLYIGKSPTLQGRSDLRIEMNLFDTLKEDLYGKEISIYPEKQIRSDIKFDSKKELIYNISQDKIEVEHYFKKSSTLSTVAILNYNGKEHLKSYLDSHSTDENHNVVLIDNRSTDGSIEFVETSHQEVQTIRLSENYGFAGGYNQGLKDVHTKYVALVNSDVRVTDNWLQPLIDLLERDETVAAVQPKILSLNTPSKFEYAGAAGGFIDILGYPFCRGRLMNHVEEDEGQYNDQIDVAWVSGAAFVIRTDLFKKAGGFDHDFFAHMEEIDLCWRLKNAGYKLTCNPSSIIYHLGGGTLDYQSSRKVYLNLRNSYWMILKNDSVNGLIWKLPVRIFSDLAYAATFLLTLKLNRFFSAIRGICIGLSGVFRVGKKRRFNAYFQNRYAIAPPDRTGFASFILPIQYYLFGKRKFKEFK